MVDQLTAAEIGQAGGIPDASGVIRQLTPEQEQIVDGEPQISTRPSSPLIEIAEPEKREVPLPITGRPPLPSAEQIAAEEAYQALHGVPVCRMNRYEGNDQDWVELVRWDIPLGYTGDLHEISVYSNNDDKTRYRIFLANVDQDIPTDRIISSPFTLPFYRTIIPSGYSCWVEVMSTDGTSIIVDGMITATVR